MKPLLILLAIGFALVGCHAGNAESSDPVERGCSYIAGAIITSAAIRALFNK